MGTREIVIIINSFYLPELILKNTKVNYLEIITQGYNHFMKNLCLYLSPGCSLGHVEIPGVNGVGTLIPRVLFY